MSRRSSLIAIGLVALAAAWPQQGPDFNQNSHYALVRALADGTPRIDRTRREVGELSTMDVSLHRGHYYSDKAPGLAAATLVPYLVLDAAGAAEPKRDPTRMLWALGLFGAVLPMLGLLLLVRYVGERLEPGYGTAAALTLGVASILLPYATLFYSHALSAFAVFAVFALLWRERRHPPALALVAAGGLVAGLSIAIEYPNALAAGLLGLYAVARGRPVQRAAAFGCGLLAGIAPLLLYNQWAFGSITHLTYEGTQTGQGPAAFGAPSLEVAVELLLSRTGLLTLMPVLALAALGAALLYRRGGRAEALLLGATAAAYIVFNASYASTFGGYAPGPRYLVSALPFLALPLALAWRRLPLTTAALGALSAVAMVVVTATHPLAGYQGKWFDRLFSGDIPLTAASLVGITGWYTIVPFFVLVALAVGYGIAATGRFRFVREDLLIGPVAVLVWLAIRLDAPRSFELGGRGRDLGAYGAVWLVVLGLALATLGTALYRSRARHAGHG